MGRSRYAADRTAETVPQVDGRRLRGERSRKQIVDAMLTLVRRGEMNPSAAQVASEAGVGLRSVFRHFEEMDTLYREMTAQIEAEIMPLALRPFEAKHWRARLDELIGRRAIIFERIMPYRVAGAARRFQSSFLMEDYTRALHMEQSALKAILPKTVSAEVFAALDLLTSFESWRRLRQDQGLSPKKSEAAIRLAVNGLLKSEG